MKVSKKDIDKLNSVLSVSIEKTDYESKVEEVIMITSSTFDS